MRLPGAIELLYLAVMLVVIPRGAIRSRGMLAEAGAADGGSPLTRRGILLQSILTLAILGVATAAAAATIGFDPFHRPARLGPGDLAIGLAGLGLTGIAGWLSRRLRTAEERRNLAIYRWMPQDGPERALFVLSAILAGVVEEAAYRGVLVAILAATVGSSIAAILISAVAFAVAHAVQGWKSAILVFLIALVMQAVVSLTGTLLIAMAVHAIYDLIAGIHAGNTARRMAANSTSEDPAGRAL